MNDERIVEYLRSRGAVEVPGGFVASVMRTVEAAPIAHARFSVNMPAYAIAAAIAAIAVLTLALVQGRDVGSEPAPSESSSATVDELRSAVASGIGRLRQSEGVEGLAQSSVLGELSTVTWFSWRPGGDQVVVERVDRHVAEGGWWMDSSGEPSSRGLALLTTLHVIVGSEYYTAGASWSVTDASEAPQALTLMTGILDGRIDPLAMLPGADGEGDVTVRSVDDGGELWTLRAPYRDGAATSEWRISRQGSLASWTAALEGVKPTPEDTSFVTAMSIVLTPLRDPAPIMSPARGTNPDPAQFGYPADDIPLGPGRYDPIPTPEQSPSPR